MPRDPSVPSPQRSGPPRLWTVPEANARLATLGELLDELKRWAARLGEVSQELRRLTSFWGAEIGAIDHVDHALHARLEAESERLARRLHEGFHGLAEEGIEVKDLSTGLVDFYAVIEGELVFLCWRRDEPSVAHFHTLGSGFRGRRPIPELSSAVPDGPRSTL